jgi:ABC-type spermidine/putrescine transport system permease subunit I
MSAIKLVPGPSGIRFVLPLGLAMLVAFNIPVVLMLAWGFTSPQGALAPWADLIERTVYLRVLGNTFRIALICTLTCAVLGYPLAYWLCTLRGRARMIALALVVLPFWVSILVRTYAWIVVLGNNGVVNRSLLQLGLVGEPLELLYNELGVVIGTTNVLLPFLVLPLFATMLGIDRRLLQAAAGLGASPGTVFWKVFFPLTLPGLLAGCILVFILTLGFFITPAILGGGRVSMIANMIDILINRMPRWELAAALSTVLLLATFVCYAFYLRLSRRPTA